jgi:DNA-binding transcriptional LysR family regulator
VELRHLRYFVAVAEEKHFGRAAARLRIAQPPLSRQIQALEAELDLSLFDRTRRKIELTPAGSVLLEHARKVFDALDVGVREARRASVGETGRISIGYPSSVAFSGLPQLLLAFRARSPGVAISLREMPPQDQMNALKQREIDVGFIRGPIVDSDLAWRCVRKEPLVVVMSESHPLAKKKRIALELLAHEPFVAFPRARGPAFFDSIMRVCHDAGFTPHVVQEAPQLDMVSLVAAGFGVAIMPSSVESARRPGVAFRPIIGSPTTTLLVAWRRDDNSPVLRDFLAVLRDVGVGPVEGP